jgi:hypothetical protein
LLAELNSHELRLLDWLLPADKAFYALVQAKLDKLKTRRHPDGSIEFGSFDDDLADTIAIGEIASPHSTVTLRMDEALSGALLSIPQLGHDTKLLWTLSDWSPGRENIREIELRDVTGKLHFVLALSPLRGVLWLHHVDSGFNQLLPMTGVLVELARLKKMPSTARLTHDAFFELADRSSDDLIAEALLEYNKRARKFDASRVSVQISGSERGNGFFNNFSKRR